MTDDDARYSYRLCVLATERCGVAAACRLRVIHRSTCYRWKNSADGNGGSKVSADDVSPLRREECGVAVPRDRRDLDLRLGAELYASSRTRFRDWVRPTC